MYAPMLRVALTVIATSAVAAGCGPSNQAHNTTSGGSRPAGNSNAPNTSAANRMTQVYIDSDETDRAYWHRAVQLLSEQDTATLNGTGNVGITIAHKGQQVTIYREDLGWLAQNVCLAKVNGEDPAKTVGIVKDVYNLPRRWEAAQIRTAALETKCPSA